MRRQDQETAIALDKQIVQPVRSDTWSHGSDTIQRVVHTPVLEHPYDNYLRRVRDNRLHLRTKPLVHLAQPARKHLVDDPFGLKVLIASI